MHGPQYFNYKLAKSLLPSGLTPSVEVAPVLGEEGILFNYAGSSVTSAPGVILTNIPKDNVTLYVTFDVTIIIYEVNAVVLYRYPNGHTYTTTPIHIDTTSRVSIPFDTRPEYPGETGEPKILFIVCGDSTESVSHAGIRVTNVMVSETENDPYQPYEFYGQLFYNHNYIDLDKVHVSEESSHKFYIPGRGIINI